jgi:serine/threonine-protein kinase HipA
LTAGPLEGDKVRNFFDNLLPDSESIRLRIQTRHGLQRADTFSLLQAIGRDCVGAVQLLSLGMVPVGFDEVACAPLSGKDIEEHLNGLGSQLGAANADEEIDFRLSIAGAQEKTALLKHQGRWCRPLGATPTTHILKPPIGITPGRNLDLRLSVENEWLCNQIVHALNLPAAECTMANFGAKRVLVVERFDRQMTSAGWIARLPQEDLCQARGVAGSAKYERDGGPGMAECLTVLQSSVDYPQDARTFLCAQLLFWFLAAIDGHAKNFSLFLLPGGRYRLTPLYDVLSAWPVIDAGPYGIPYKKATMAMAVRATSAHYKLSEIQPRHWEQLAKTSGVSGAWEAMLNIADRLEPALVKVEKHLPQDFPADLAQKIFAGTRRHLRKFLPQKVPTSLSQ